LLSHLPDLAPVHRAAQSRRDLAYVLTPNSCNAVENCAGEQLLLIALARALL
jgi:hypothetical protein